MSDIQLTDTWIAVDDLRVGMYVHLDMGWISHPFALSSFKITSEAQITTLRALGKPQLRWDPARSDPPPAMAEGPAAAPAPIEAGPAHESPERQQHRAALVAQREALRRCERQFGEASRSTREVFELVSARPDRAGREAATLVRALVDKMLIAPEVNIRLLTEGSGDKASHHALNVAIVSLLLGRSLGLRDEELADVGVGGLLHDVGKLDLPEAIRHREEHFTASELDYYRQHVARGVVQGRRMGLTVGALRVIEQHHEQADGQGFPLGLNVDRMAVAARIVALVNRFDGLCNPRVPARALTPHEALSTLFAQGSQQFDTTMLAAFIRMMGIYPPGSAVQLTDDRYALVVAVNPARPLKPHVLLHDPSVPREDALLLDLAVQPALAIRRSVKPLDLPRESYDYLAPRHRISYFFEPVTFRDEAPRDVAATA
jgi:putative nucleotidyltransferase with HDIG domain